jgi:glycosyltransferase involved in cell wall biosynthesis
MANPRLSIILLDWSVRESFHVFEYLKRQTFPRYQFEIIWVEFYSRRAAMRYDADKFIILDFPKDVYYHKHLMYNAGILNATGDIVVICDSDSILKETFLTSIADSFERDLNIVLHLDQVRNKDRKFYPFNYPKIADILGRGCVNWEASDKRTRGLHDTRDYLHSRNYGACMAAWRNDLLQIRGADEHIDYLGYNCGPYDMTFRLVNLGLKEIWHKREFLYHVWHPSEGGSMNYSGPHDGKNMSTRALENRSNGRVLPWLENLAYSGGDLIDQERVSSWSSLKLKIPA